MKLGIKLAMTMAALLDVDSLVADCDLATSEEGVAGTAAGAQAEWQPLVRRAFTPNRLAGTASVHDEQNDIAGDAEQPRIVGIDLANKVAIVKADMRFNGRRYTDYMLLLNSKGEWRITNKIATWEKLND